MALPARERGEDDTGLDSTADDEQPNVPADATLEETIEEATKTTEPVAPPLPTDEGRVPLIADGRSAPAIVTTSPPPPDSERFHDDDYTPVLVAMAKTLVDRHGMMPLTSLARKVSREHGFQRTGRIIAERVAKCLALVETHDEFEVKFVRPVGFSVQQAKFQGLDGRGVRDVSRHEIASVLARTSEPVDEAEDPALELSRQLGMSRLHRDSRLYLDQCLEWWRESCNRA